MTVISTQRSFSPSVDYGSDHPSVTFDGGEAYPEQVRGLPLYIFCPTDSINSCAGLRNWPSYIRNALWLNAAARLRQSDENLVNSSATVGTEPGGTYWYSLDINSLTHRDLPHT